MLSLNSLTWGRSLSIVDFKHAIFMAVTPSDCFKGPRDSEAVLWQCRFKDLYVVFILKIFFGATTSLLFFGEFHCMALFSLSQFVLTSQLACSARETSKDLHMLLNVLCKQFRCNTKAVSLSNIAWIMPTCAIKLGIEWWNYSCGREICISCSYKPLNRTMYHALRTELN